MPEVNDFLDDLYVVYQAQVSLGGKLASRLRVDIVSVKYLLNVRTSGGSPDYFVRAGRQACGTGWEGGWDV